MAKSNALVAVLAAGFGAVVAAGEALQPPPSFRSSTALLVAEATVFTKDGRPVTDLRAVDFSARLDGKPRNVVFARFRGSPTGDGPPTLAPVPSTAFVSNISRTAGQVVVIVIDQESIQSGQERPALETASKFVDGLSPADAVGLLAFPTIAVNLTRDHARVKAALSHVSGGMPKMVETGWTGNHYITLDEADKITRGDRQVRRQGGAGAGDAVSAGPGRDGEVRGPGREAGHQLRRRLAAEAGPVWSAAIGSRS